MKLSPLFLSAAIVCATPSAARAQWYVAGTLGANASQPSTIVVDRPSADTRIEIADVHWISESFIGPQYYGYRVGRMMGGHRRWALEFEFVHPKMFGATARTVRISGTLHGEPVNLTAPMNTVVPRYNMSHGMNVAVGNVVFRRPMGRPERAALTSRIGIGVAIPHDETTMDGESMDRYEFGGVAVQAGAGIDIHLVKWFWLLAEYKLAFARPGIAIAGGIGRTSAIIHQIAFGPVISMR